MKGVLYRRRRHNVQNLSRRAFLCRSGLAGVSTVIVDAVPITSSGASDERRGPAAVGPGAVPVTFILNGSARVITVEPRMTLAEALRGPLELTGTKIACNRGSCSARTVWLDGAPICSCMMLAIEAEGRSVTTIEGLATAETLHPVQEAFIEQDALQCGFCTPGLVMSCAALLAQTADPTVEDIQAAIAGHYCRCGTYPHVVAATLAAAKMQRG
jgi:xanthine dehydrogenase YagT iron-sulfur-binding subunit